MPKTINPSADKATKPPARRGRPPKVKPEPDPQTQADLLDKAPDEIRLPDVTLRHLLVELIASADPVSLGQRLSTLLNEAEPRLHLTSAPHAFVKQFETLKECAEWDLAGTPNPVIARQVAAKLLRFCDMWMVINGLREMTELAEYGFDTIDETTPPDSYLMKVFLQTIEEMNRPPETDDPTVRLTYAIERETKVKIFYRDVQYSVEPYAIAITQDDRRVLFGWQARNWSDAKAEQAFVCYDLPDIERVQIMKQSIRPRFCFRDMEQFKETKVEGPFLQRFRRVPPELFQHFKSGTMTSFGRGYDD